MDAAEQRRAAMDKANEADQRHKAAEVEHMVAAKEKKIAAEDAATRKELANAKAYDKK